MGHTVHALDYDTSRHMDGTGRGWWGHLLSTRGMGRGPWSGLLGGDSATRVPLRCPDCRTHPHKDTTLHTSLPVSSTTIDRGVIERIQRRQKSPFNIPKDSMLRHSRNKDPHSIRDNEVQQNVCDSARSHYLV